MSVNVIPSAPFEGARSVRSSVAMGRSSSTTVSLPVDLETTSTVILPLLPAVMTLKSDSLMSRIPLCAS